MTRPSRLERLRRLYTLALVSEISAEPRTAERRARARRTDHIAAAVRAELLRTLGLAA